MKKIVCIVMSIIFLYSFRISFLDRKFYEERNLAQIDEKICLEFVIPERIKNLAYEDLYPFLFETAKNMKLNVIRNYHTYMGESPILNKYILQMGESKIYDYIKLSSGKKLSVYDTQNTNKFLSTEQTHDKNQVGTIKNFADQNKVSLYPLEYSYKFMPFGGYYYLETTDKKQLEDFCQTLADKLNDYFKFEDQRFNFTRDEFFNINAHGDYFSNYVRYMRVLNYLGLIFSLIFVCYYVMNSSKKIGILKLNGISNFKIWYLLIGKFITGIFLLTCFVCAIATMFIRDANINFLLLTFKYQFQLYIAALISTFCAYLFFSRVKLQDIIKDKSSEGIVFYFNLFAKAIFSAILLMILCTMLTQSCDVKLAKDNLKYWETASNFASFRWVLGERPWSYDDFTKHGSRKFDSKVASFLIMLRDSKAANFIIVDADDFTEADLIINKDNKPVRYLKVNDKYLNKFEVKDENGERISVRSDSGITFLIPGNCRDKTDFILKDFFKYRKQDNANKIIYTQCGQKIFSFDTRVFPTENNMVNDPVIVVISDSLIENLVDENNKRLYYGTILGNAINNPLKIELIDKDPILTYEKLKPYLAQNEIEDQLINLITVDDAFQEKIDAMHKEINHGYLAFSVALLTLLFISFQSTVIYFRRNKDKLIIKKMFGYGFIKTYRNCFIVGLICSLLQILIYVSVSYVNYKYNGGANVLKFELNGNWSMAYFIILLVDFSFVVLYLSILEKKNKLKILKGGA